MPITSMLLRRKETAAVGDHGVGRRGGTAGKQDRHAADVRFHQGRAGKVLVLMRTQLGLRFGTVEWARV